jgi:hypothetical protein
LGQVNDSLLAARLRKIISTRGNLFAIRVSYSRCGLFRFACSFFTRNFTRRKTWLGYLSDEVAGGRYLTDGWREEYFCNGINNALPRDLAKPFKNSGLAQEAPKKMIQTVPRSDPKTDVSSLLYCA